jgi:hypothetical protein
MDDGRVSKKFSQKRKRTKHRTPTIKMERPAYSSRGRNRSRMAKLMEMMMMMMMMTMILNKP